MKKVEKIQITVFCIFAVAIGLLEKINNLFGWLYPVFLACFFIWIIITNQQE